MPCGSPTLVDAGPRVRYWVRADGFAVRPYRLYFYSHEPNEPPHVHVDRDDQSAKFWLGQSD